MNCAHCGQEVHGELEVLDLTPSDPAAPFMITIASTPDRDWILCDICNAMRCHACCTYPQSGYCDACITKYQLYDDLVAAGHIPKRL